MRLAIRSVIALLVWAMVMGGAAYAAGDRLHTRDRDQLRDGSCVVYVGIHQRDCDQMQGGAQTGPATRTQTRASA